MAGPLVTDSVMAPGWSPWRIVVGFGLVSLAGDMVYEGARSVYGPLRASLGDSATIVGWSSEPVKPPRCCCGWYPAAHR